MGLMSMWKSVDLNIDLTVETKENDFRWDHSAMKNIIKN